MNHNDHRKNNGIDDDDDDDGVFSDLNRNFVVKHRLVCFEIGVEERLPFWRYGECTCLTEERNMQRVEKKVDLNYGYYGDLTYIIYHFYDLIVQKCICYKTTH